MNTTVNKFLVALVTVLGATGALIADGLSVNDGIAMLILFANALGVYAIPNKPDNGATLLRATERGSLDIRYAVGILTVASLVFMGCADAEPEPATRTDATVQMTGANHSFNSYHAGAYYYAGVKQSDARIILVMDRTTDPATKQGLREYIGAMVALWQAYPGLPYLYYIDDSANAGGCFADGRGGHVSDAVGLTSMMLVCNGSPSGDYGRAWWAIRNQHLYGEANVWLDARGDAGYHYTQACHEIGHVLQFPDHATEQASCMYTPINLSSPGDRYKGYTQNDLNELLSNYYSHGLTNGS